MKISHGSTVESRRSSPLIKNGEIIEENLQEQRINERALGESLRLSGYRADPATIKRALFERNGSVSVVSQQREVQVVADELREGVETIRLKLFVPSGA